MSGNFGYLCLGFTGVAHLQKACELSSCTARNLVVIFSGIVKVNVI
jgi:hypothetical protein